MKIMGSSVGHDLSQGMIWEGIFEMSEGVRRSELLAGLFVVCLFTVG